MSTVTLKKPIGIIMLGLRNYLCRLNYAVSVWHSMNLKCGITQILQLHRSSGAGYQIDKWYEAHGSGKKEFKLKLSFLR